MNSAQRTLQIYVFCSQVALIMGVAGACRCDELARLKTDDIEDLKSALLVKIPRTKTGNCRSFTIIGEKCLRICRKYASLRPKDYEERRFFIKYHNGKCQRMVVGIHKISSTAREVAKYLNLENFSEYTGHSLRRTSATILVDSGGDLTCLKRHGGWRSDTVAEGYIEGSLENKMTTARKIFSVNETSKPSTSANSLFLENSVANNQEKIVKEKPNQETFNSVIESEVTALKHVGNVDCSGLINFQSSCSKCTFNITINK